MGPVALISAVPSVLRPRTGDQSNFAERAWRGRQDVVGAGELVSPPPDRVSPQHDASNRALHGFVMRKVRRVAEGNEVGSPCNACVVNVRAIARCRPFLKNKGIASTRGPGSKATTKEVWDKEGDLKDRIPSGNKLIPTTPA